ncbi:MAG: hypothetical protein HY226_05905 [Candidatus Vogelbacteria bacterium]|nr:hypothetical protein [Candidatus Vogelbacteria bacterium]
MITKKSDLLGRMAEEQRKRAETLYRQINAKLEAEYRFGGSGVEITFIEQLVGRTFDDILVKAAETEWEVVVLSNDPKTGTRLKFV